MPDNRSEKYRKAFTQGQEAVRRRPRYAPANPYEEIDPKTGEATQEWQGWEDGAFSAGITEVYTNGQYTG
jgi:hypothetical protein